MNIDYINSKIDNQTTDNNVINITNVERRYFTRREILKILKIGNQTFQELEKLGLKYVKLGNKHLFDIQDIYRIFEENKR